MKPFIFFTTPKSLNRNRNKSSYVTKDFNSP